MRSSKGSTKRKYKGTKSEREDKAPNSKANRRLESESINIIKSMFLTPKEIVNIKGTKNRNEQIKITALLCFNKKVKIFFNFQQILY